MKTLIIVFGLVVVSTAQTSSTKMESGPAPKCGQQYLPWHWVAPPIPNVNYPHEPPPSNKTIAKAKPEAVKPIERYTIIGNEGCDFIKTKPGAPPGFNTVKIGSSGQSLAMGEFTPIVVK